jgi:hypothetical protein
MNSLLDLGRIFSGLFACSVFTLSLAKNIRVAISKLFVMCLEIALDHFAQLAEFLSNGQIRSAYCLLINRGHKQTEAPLRLQRHPGDHGTEPWMSTKPIKRRAAVVFGDRSRQHSHIEQEQIGCSSHRKCRFQVFLDHSYLFLPVHKRDLSSNNMCLPPYDPQGKSTYDRGRYNCARIQQRSDAFSLSSGWVAKILREYRAVALRHDRHEQTSAERSSSQKSLQWCARDTHSALPWSCHHSLRLLTSVKR